VASLGQFEVICEKLLGEASHHNRSGVANCHSLLS
jgi:hypothetical protein